MVTASAETRWGSRLKRTRRGLVTVAIVVVAVVALVFGTFLLGRSWQAGPVSVSSSPTITEIQKLGDLVVLRVSVADVMEDAGYEYKGVWIVRGDAEIAVDLQQAQLQSTVDQTKTLVVLLPSPRVIHPRVDHEKSKVFDVTKTTWVPWVGDKDELTNQGWTKAQGVVESACSGDELMDQAREQTQFVLSNMYRLVGWNIEVVWQDGSEASTVAE